MATTPQPQDSASGAYSTVSKEVREIAAPAAPLADPQRRYLVVLANGQHALRAASDDIYRTVQTICRLQQAVAGTLLHLGNESGSPGAAFTAEALAGQVGTLAANVHRLNRAVRALMRRNLHDSPHACLNLEVPQLVAERLEEFTSTAKPGSEAVAEDSEEWILEQVRAEVAGMRLAHDAAGSLHRLTASVSSLRGALFCDPSAAVVAHAVSVAALALRIASEGDETFHEARTMNGADRHPVEVARG
jgi:hypothetical protein